MNRLVAGKLYVLKSNQLMYGSVFSKDTLDKPLVEVQPESLVIFLQGVNLAEMHPERSMWQGNGTRSDLYGLCLLCTDGTVGWVRMWEHEIGKMELAEP